MDCLGGTLYWIHTGHLMEPRFITDASGAVVGYPCGDYSPLRTEVCSAATSLALRFPGRYHMAETGYSYNYFRDYGPETGRYLQSDPIGLQGGLNTYAYANNNPLSFIDPDGLNPLLIYRAIRIGATGLKVLSKRISKAEAKRLLREGKDVAGSKKMMKKLQKEKGTGRPIRERPEGGTEHYHRGDREGGHGFIPDKLPGVILIPGTGLSGEALPSSNSPDPVPEDVYDLFCALNPGAPNCRQEDCP